MSIVHVDDPSTGMELERIDKLFDGVSFRANLVVNAASKFDPDSFRYAKRGDVWILFGCPLVVNGKAGKCSVKGKNAQVAQHVLYESFEEQYVRFVSGELQRTWAKHQEKMEKLS